MDAVIDVGSAWEMKESRKKRIARGMGDGTCPRGAPLMEHAVVANPRIPIIDRS